MKLLATVVIIQLVAPLVFGAPIWLWSDISVTPRKRSDRKRGRASADAPDTLVDRLRLRCAQAGQ